MSVGTIAPTVASGASESSLTCEDERPFTSGHQRANSYKEYDPIVFENSATADPPESPTISYLEDIQALRLSGNEFFKAAKYYAAIQEYRSAIRLLDDKNLNLDPEVRESHLSMVLCNLSLCHLKTEHLGVAVSIATRAITESKGKYAKAYFRRGTAFLALSKYEAALKDFRSASLLVPNDAATTRCLELAKRLYKEQQFAKAIHLVDEKPPSRSINFTAWPIPENYDGPIYLGKDDRTPEFFSKLLEFYKAKVENKLPKRSMAQLAVDIIAAYREEPNIISIDLPNDVHESITICGDVHGQFYDLYNIFRMNGMPSATNKYLFNGDFVDRGSFSVEVITTLYLAKLIWPDGFYLTRGNHECRRLTEIYGFKGEMKDKGNQSIYDIYCESFQHLPLAHSINGRVFVVHGGLSATPGVTIEQINKIERRTDEEEELMSDLLWADPQVENGSAPSKRGVSHTFGPDITQTFLQTNNYELVVRSHEVKLEGYEIEHGGKVITVFSAPNYCDHVRNKGAYLKFNGAQLNAPGKLRAPSIHPFEDVPHPPVNAMAYASPLLSFM